MLKTINTKRYISAIVLFICIFSSFFTNHTYFPKIIHLYKLFIGFYFLNNIFYHFVLFAENIPLFCHFLSKTVYNNNSVTPQAESIKRRVKVRLDGAEMSVRVNSVVDVSTRYTVEAIYDKDGLVSEMKVTTNN